MFPEHHTPHVTGVEAEPFGRGSAEFKLSDFHITQIWTEMMNKAIPSKHLISAYSEGKAF